MKTLLVAGISVILILIMGWRSETSDIQEQVEVQLEQSQALNDSAMILLKELHDKNDSLLTEYFGK
jgi:hypothetical protein